MGPTLIEGTRESGVTSCVSASMGLGVGLKGIGLEVCVCAIRPADDLLSLPLSLDHLEHCSLSLSVSLPLLCSLSLFLSSPHANSSQTLSSFFFPLFFLSLLSALLLT